MKRTAFIIIALFGLLLARSSRAAVLSVLPEGNGQIGLILNTQGESVNAVEVHLSFDPQEFTVQGLSDGGSAVNFWVEQPAFSNSFGTIDLSGIIPGGIVTASGTIITITIAPAKTGSSKGFIVTSATALLNDGKGTAAKLAISSGPFPIATLSASSSTAVATPFDTQGPDPFMPEIAHNQDIFNGKYFLVFAATDQYSGIDHYEVLEQSRNGAGSSIGTWQTAESPYLLRDQSLSSNIYVRAVDKSGNFRVVRLMATNASAPYSSAWYRRVFIIGLGILILIGFLWLIWRRRKK